MVRVFCAPKSLEEQFIKKIEQLTDDAKKTIADVIKLQRGYDDVRVALCTDGGASVTTANVAWGLKELYRVLGITAEVSVQRFSFLSVNIAQQQQILQNADIFWFAGVHRVPQGLRAALSRTDDETGGNDLAAQVRRRVQYNIHSHGRPH
jgi:hypothetical protein